MKFSKTRYMTILMYLMNRCMDKPNIGKTVLMYFLYYMDFNYYEMYGSSMTNETYKKDKKGLMVSTHFNEIMNELVECGVMYTRKEDYYGRSMNKYYMTKFLDLEMSYLEMHMIDDVLMSFGDWNSWMISQYTCSDVPYQMCDFGEVVEYFYTYYSDETSVSYLMYDFFSG